MILLIVLVFPQGLVGGLKRCDARWQAGMSGGAAGRRPAQGLRRRAGGRGCRPSPSRPGELLALIGPNGAGKTTCFNMLNGQLEPDSGGSLLDGRNIVGLSPRAIWRLGVGRTFQITATFASMSVRENVQMALYRHAGRLGRSVALRRGAARARPTRCSRRSACSTQAERACGVLAYGDLKRVELAMALANQPRLLLMDEPTAGMAPSERIALMELTARLARERRSRCCSPSTTWTWSSAMPTASSCSTAAALIADGLPPRCAPIPTCRRSISAPAALQGAH